jgi:hypothetical protein
MGLLYGGLVMSAPYTQAERERLELVADEPQDLGTTDGRALAVYGARLRGPTAGLTAAQFLARPGIGMCLTGYGSPCGYQAGTFTHEVFAVGKTADTITVYDPLAPPGAGPTDKSVSYMAGWLKGLGGNDLREIRANELGAGDMGETIVTLSVYPEGPRVWRAAGGLTTGYLPNGSTKQATFAAGSWAHADGVASITQDPQKAPNGSGFVHLVDGVLAGYYLVRDAGAVDPAPEPPADEDYATGYADGEADEAERWAGWLDSRPVGELEVWAGTAPRGPAEPAAAFAPGTRWRPANGGQRSPNAPQLTEAHGPGNGPAAGPEADG